MPSPGRRRRRRSCSPTSSHPPEAVAPNCIPRRRRCSGFRGCDVLRARTDQHTTRVGQHHRDLAKVPSGSGVDPGPANLDGEGMELKRWNGFHPTDGELAPASRRTSSRPSFDQIAVTSRPTRTPTPSVGFPPASWPPRAVPHTGLSVAVVVAIDGRVVPVRWSCCTGRATEGSARRSPPLRGAWVGKFVTVKWARPLLVGTFDSAGPLSPASVGPMDEYIS